MVFIGVFLSKGQQRGIPFQATTPSWSAPDIEIFTELPILHCGVHRSIKAHTLLDLIPCALYLITQKNPQICNWFTYIPGSPLTVWYRLDVVTLEEEAPCIVIRCWSALWLIMPWHLSIRPTASSMLTNAYCASLKSRFYSWTHLGSKFSFETNTCSPFY